MHRDLKPHNLLLTADRNLKISDFGLLKEASGVELDLTMHGAVLGTPHYIAPEQALGEAVDERSDIYSLGASFFHSMTGRLAFQERSSTAMLLKITQHDAPALLEVAPHVSRPLAVIIDRMMALRPEDRYQNVRVILEDMKSYAQRGLLKIALVGNAPDARSADELSPDITQVFRPRGRQAGLGSGRHCCCRCIGRPGGRGNSSGSAGRMAHPTPALKEQRAHRFLEPAERKL